MPRTARVAPGRVLFHVLVERAEDWRWSSLWRWRHPEVTEEVPPLTAWPLERPRQWLLQSTFQPLGRPTRHK